MLNMVIGDYVGLPAVGQPNGNVPREIQAYVNSSVNPILGGDLVGLNANTTVTPWNGTATFAGIAVLNHRPNTAIDQTNVAYEQGDTVDVMREGRIFVTLAAGNPVAGGPAYFTTVGGKTVITADTGGTLLPNVKFANNFVDRVDPTNNVVEVEIRA